MIRMDRGPHLLIDWEPRGKRFLEDCGVLCRRGSRLPRMESVDGTVGLSGPCASLLLHCALILGYVFLGPSVSRYLPHEVPLRSLTEDTSEAIVYYSPHLPAVEDARGSASGEAGQAGGRQIRSPHLVRTSPLAALSSSNVEAPKLHLPSSRSLVADIVAVPMNPPPAPPVGQQALNHLPQPALQVPAPPAAPAAAPPPVLVREDIDAAEIRKLQLPASDPMPPKVASSSRVPAVAALPTKPNLALPKSAPATRTEIRPLAVIITSDPGDRIAAPDGGPGVVSLAPTGRSIVGTGGKGNGSGAADGGGSGAASRGLGPGAGKTGSGAGNTLADKGTTLGTGPGGAGRSSTGSSGVAINGPVVFIPSFGGPSANVQGAKSPRQPGASKPPSVVVIASGRSGGGLNVDFAPPGKRVYTIYLDTRAGTAVLQYASTSAGFDGDLTPPQPIRTETPPGLQHAQTLIECVLDAFGALRDLHIVRQQDPAIAAKLKAALAHWQFRPAMRAGRAVEVRSIIGLGVGTE